MATKHKATKKSKPSAPKIAQVTKLAVANASKSQQTKSAPAKPQEKKRKLVTKISEAPSPAKRSKAGKVTKKLKPKSPLQLINEFVDECVPENEPRLNDEEAATQREIEESLKEVHDAHRGLLPPVVIREPDSGKFQPLPEVQGKGKEKVSDEQVALDLLTLQTPKKKSPTEQYIFQRRTSTPTESSGHDESSSLYDEHGLTVNETEFDEEVSGIVARVQDEVQAGPNPGEHDEGQDGPNPGDVAASQPLSSHVVHVGPNLKHMDLEASDTSIQPNPEQMDEEFTTTAYPNVQENLKLPTEGEVRLEEPASSAGTLSSLQNLDKELSFTNQFLLAEKSTEDPNLRKPILKEAAVQAPLPTLTTTTTTTITTLPLPPQPQQGSTESSNQHIGKLEQHMADLPPPLPPPAGLSGTLGTSGASGSSQLPHPPSPSTNQSDQSTSTAAPRSSKIAASAEYTDWMTTDTRLKPSVLSIPEDLHMDDDTTPDEQVHSSGDEDIGHDHIPTVNLKQNWWKPLTEDMPATPVPTWSIPSSDLLSQCTTGHSCSHPLLLPPMHLHHRTRYLRRLSIKDTVQEWQTCIINLKDEAAYYPDVGLEQMDQKLGYQKMRRRLLTGD
ncbi:hypothetical protein Tco_0688797, partial [Tanacetum coccineum]